MPPAPDERDIEWYRTGAVIRARVAGTWYEGEPWHRLIISNGEYDPDARQWNQPPILTWQLVTKEDWDRG